ncbi:unnamed protein product [Trifolium pratense]|uniref:Uncharacterized protein n=1 Tax=Trifolium pratense TaxID=57577 RepID=A0ACB0JC13_TRIPR|nr:unnamed protein product [Trifolium pratense]
MKKTKYGFGKLAPNVRHENLIHIPTPEERSRLVPLPPATQAEIQRLTQELQAQREELNRRAQQDEERHQMMQQMMEEQRREMSALKEMLASSSRNAPIDETNPHEDSTNSNNGDTDAN